MRLSKLLLVATVALLAGMLGIVGCAKDSSLAVDADGFHSLEGSALSIVAVNGAASDCVPLIAGRTINAGTVCFDDVDTNGDDAVDALRITITTSDWSLADVKIWAGTSMANAPVNRAGNPVPGHFPYKSSDLSGTSYTLDIPFSALGITCDQMVPIFVAVHAEVSKNGKSETAWSDGVRFTAKGNWATYTTIVVTCDQIEEPPDDVCETAFAYGPISTCLPEVLDFDRFEFPFEGTGWGWALGPLQPGTHQFDILARGGTGDVCSPGGGIKVGTVTVKYENGTATVTYTADPTYGFNEAYLHVGALPYPEGIANYPIQPEDFEFTATDLNKAATWSQTKTELSGAIYIIARSTVCGPF